MKPSNTKMQMKNVSEMRARRIESQRISRCGRTRKVGAETAICSFYRVKTKEKSGVLRFFIQGLGVHRGCG